MTAGTSSDDTMKQLRYLAAALKAPRITQAAQRLADQARDAGWTHEDYLAAVLEREVSARNASGAQLRIRAAGFPARRPPADRLARLRRLPHRSPQHRATRTARNRQNAPGDLPRNHRGPARPPGPVRHRHRLGHKAHRRPPTRPA